MTKESDLYAPVKALLETKGYRVKAEVNGCDVVAIMDDEPIVIVELKLAFSLELVLQGVNRQSITNDVYLAVPAPDTTIKRRNWRSRQRGYVKLCRLLGLGLILVDLFSKRKPATEVLIDPLPYSPRKSKVKQTRLMREFVAREGDPNTGGVNRTKIITAYRQDSLRCALVLSKSENMKVKDIRTATGVEKAGSILQKNHYNWFERTERGIYRLSPAGMESLKVYVNVLPSLDDVPT